ncbi:peptidyl-tRNA hydrolase [Sanghuangporus baumii]|uniref:Peptidyl-tRNA hydrolase n=1 Tax=Sanghuangporus baumii TaxID=108892 RepID=A0A9Q5HYQ1_SANBA|nr:peptidyl-tRNA hydrolase [Sanghuangporus baumii]
MSTVPRILLTGLGNFPLPRTRHSIGHYILDSFSERLGLKPTLNEGLDGFIADGETTLNDKPVHLYLFKARPPMNVQGQPIAKASRYAGIQPHSVIVMHDTMKLQPACLRVKYGGAPDGHRGIRSVNKFLHTLDYFRIQVGVGRSGDAKEYVLGPLSAFEKQHFGVNGEGTDEVWEAIGDIAKRMDKLRVVPLKEE